MADLDRIQDDLGFVRRTVEGAAPRSIGSIYFLWALIWLVGFTLVDLRPHLVGWYWAVAGPIGFLVSAYLGYRNHHIVSRTEGVRHMQHWAAMMIVIFMMVPLMGPRGVTGEAFGPIVLLIVALSYFQGSLYLDPNYKWGGLLMLVGYVAVLTISTYAWTIMGVLAAAAMALLGVLEHRRHAITA